MEGWTTERVFNALRKDILELVELSKKNEQEITDTLQENLTFFRNMVAQVSDESSSALLLKTPKTIRKNQVQRIETIHEDETVEFEVTRTTSTVTEQKEDNYDEDDNSSNRRSRRTASKKAASSIKKQQHSKLNGKLRRPSQAEENAEQKEPKDGYSSSEEERYQPPRQSKTRKVSIQKKKNDKELPQENNKNCTFILESGNKNGKESSDSKDRVSTTKRKHDETKSPSPQPNDHRSSRTRSGEPAAKRTNVIDESMETSSLNDTLESSIYEDAIGRPAPIHNSTKIIDTTVTLEPKRREGSKNSNKKSRDLDDTLKIPNDPKINETVTLATATKRKKNFAANEQDMIDDEDVVDCTPEVKNLTKHTTQFGYQPKIRAAKNTHKANQLFSPYATDSVKKRVEAFEQAGLNSPKTVEIDAPTRVTRTKTRAMAAAEASANTTQTIQPVQSIAQKLARKSLAKAKKISLAKQIKETDDSKENENFTHAPMKISKLFASNEKLMQKMQLKITPIGKSRLQQPMSVNRLQHTPLTVQPLSNHSKAMSASRTNIISSMDSFLQPTKQARKLSSAERIEEKKRKANEEDARRKREEALKALSDEKRRKREEKVLKNKLAREAQEKLDREKRLKAEKEREEKAKIALQIQEKQREEAERKRLIQLQRAQEIEERRKQEEQLRLQRLQEQEEMERQLAEQKRKEQENAEKQHQRRHAEAKAQQQQALAEAAKLKAAQNPVKTAKHLNNTHTLPKQAHAPTTYQLESETDEDDDASDNEEAPKHPVPTWATAHVRKEQLRLQTYIPQFEVHRYFDSRQCTPDLTKIFEAIDKRRLKRTSSAIWKTPPRYSMMYTE